MDATIRTNIILAAVAAAGPLTDTDGDGWHARVVEAARNITVMVGETSRVAKAIDAIGSAKVFTGSVVSIKRQPSSTRGVITLHTGTEKAYDGVPAGCEQIRTERTDDPLGLSMAQQVKALIGHRVAVWVNVETWGPQGEKMRVLVHIQDLGLSTEPMAVRARQALEARSAA